MANIRRLNILLDYLEEEVPSLKFNMGYWGKKMPVIGFCGCALGWGTQCPALKEEGLRMNGWDFGFIPSYEGHIDYSAALHFFDLSIEETQYLFGGSHDRSLKEEIALLRTFIHQKEADILQRAKTSVTAMLDDLTTTPLPIQEPSD